MTQRIAIGVIGVGHLGAHHARILSQSPCWSLAGVFDLDAQKNQSVALQHGLSIFDSSEALIENSDALVICTPTHSHATLATQAITSGKHVFVEKPLCATDHEAASLLSLISDQGVTGAVGHIERFNPAVVAARDEIHTPRFIEAHRLNLFSPRGLATDVVLEMMIHDIDLARWLVGSEPVEIRAAGVPVLSETDDIANCRLAFDNGCVANLTASRISATPMRKLRIFSTNRYTSIDLHAKTSETYILSDAQDSGLANGYMPVASWQGRAIGRRSFESPDSNALADELNDFHDAIVNRRPPRVDFNEGARSLRVALAVAQACRDSAQKIRHKTPVSA